MERNTILAFVLSFLILIMWSYIFGQKEQAPVQKDVTTQQEIREIPPAATLKADIDQSPPPIAISKQPKESTVTPAVMEKEIVVTTPLYRAVFSNRGATITGFQLKKYLETIDPKSDPVELVNLRENDKDFFSTDFSPSPESHKSPKIYNVNHDSLNLDRTSGPAELIFEHTDPEGVTTLQTYRFYSDSYGIDLKFKLSNKSESPVMGNISANLKNLPPQDKKSYYSFIGFSLLIEDELEKIKTKKMEEEKLLSGKIGWMAYENDYFISAIIPEDQKNGIFKGLLLDSGIIRATYLCHLMEVRPGEEVSTVFTLFMGPRDVDILKQFGNKLDLAINFGFFDIIARPLHSALRFFNKYVHNYGISIIILTILIKILFWPLTHKSYKSMKEMQKLQPLMAKIREKYKDNREQMQKELMGLYKTYKVNPMGGCLPMLIQIPVFFALFRILGNSIELRQAPFLFWINDLSAPDRLFNFPFSIPFMSPPYGIPVLTLLMGASMFIQQKMTPTPGDPSQAKVMMFLPIIFTVMFINFPSGLVLYWLTNNLLSIGQQYRIKKGSS